MVTFLYIWFLCGILSVYLMAKDDAQTTKKSLTLGDLISDFPIVLVIIAFGIPGLLFFCWIKLIDERKGSRILKYISEIVLIKYKG